ncbi:hypothetical protein JYU20_00625 [Bacteroidales bacterium AH-315-I05]|nr:hypothetical protein [Bacteroidales bacterium AH-315-I05]
MSDIVKKEEKQGSWLSQKFKEFGNKSAIKMLPSMIPMLKPLVKMAGPKILAFLQGYDEETKEQGEERVLVMWLSKSDKNKVIVQIMKRPLMELRHHPTDAIEQIYDVNEFVNKFIGGQLDANIKEEAGEEQKQLPEKSE